MNKLFSLLLSIQPFLVSAQAPVQKWNRQMQLKTCNINVSSNLFTATTVIEMEFYNSNEQELEGLYNFQLNPGQVITGFQLELNDKYREGSIEEKWKATNAYNRIVGKRVDPALLTKDYDNHYSLHIYPVPPKGSRRIKFTVLQLMVVKESRLQYQFPLNVADTVANFNLSILTESKDEIPVSEVGLITGKIFNASADHFSLQYNASNILLKSSIEFSIPMPGQTTVCIQQKDSVNHFAIYVNPFLNPEPATTVNDLVVYWDASTSNEKRNVNKEISFLQQFIGWHQIANLTIRTFNYKILDEKIFKINNGYNGKWQQYLRQVNYAGATQLGCINMDENPETIAMIFTDGINTYGNKKPRTNNAMVYCINSANSADTSALKDIVGASGGHVINLQRSSIATAIALSNKQVSWLINITNASGKTTIEQPMPLKLESPVFLNGETLQDTDTLYLYYGNALHINKVEKIVLQSSAACTNNSRLDRITMLQQYATINQHYNWENILDFGISEQVVTQHTAYIVLEKATDYIKYNIAPPKELEAECEQLNYVKTDSRLTRERLRKKDEFEIINNVVEAYNQRVKKIDKNETVLTPDKAEINKLALTNSFAENTQNTNVGRSLPTGQSLLAVGTGRSNLDEVVVIGYGVMQKRNVTGAVSYISGRDLQQVGSVEQALQGRVAGVQVTNASGAPGSNASVMIRGAASINGNNQPLVVLDGVPVFGNINELVNINNIQSITVLKGPEAGAMYGSRASNGVIVLASKKGNYNRYYPSGHYRLKVMEDMDYMNDVKLADVKNKKIEYQKLQQEYGEKTGFHIDMAQHFFEAGLKKDAFEILLNAAETANGNRQVLKGMAYILESWKEYDEAIKIYKQLMDDASNDPALYRNLAWNYFQLHKYQEAVNTMYAGIRLNTGSNENNFVQLKTAMLSELHAMITIKKNELDLSMIPASIIASVPIDLRVVLDCNTGYVNFTSVNEPGLTTATYNKQSKNGGVILGSENYYNGRYSTGEYLQKNARPGTYKININYYDYYNGEIPTLMRICTFKNFGKQNQEITTECVILDNQYGDIEVTTINVPQK
ncbi:MAG: VIT domain-containing protein [Ferruginibacter sp.]